MNKHFHKFGGNIDKRKKKRDIKYGSNRNYFVACFRSGKVVSPYGNTNTERQIRKCKYGNTESEIFCCLLQMIGQYSEWDAHDSSATAAVHHFRVRWSLEVC